MPVIARRALTDSDREEISRGIAQGLEGRQIAEVIGRCPSVVSREIKRHGGRGSYRATHAGEQAALDRCRPKTRKPTRAPRVEPSPPGTRTPHA